MVYSEFIVGEALWLHAYSKFYARIPQTYPQKLWIKLFYVQLNPFHKCRHFQYIFLMPQFHKHSLPRRNKANHLWIKLL